MFSQTTRNSFDSSPNRLERTMVSTGLTSWQMGLIGGLGMLKISIECHIDR